MLRTFRAIRQFRATRTNQRGRESLISKTKIPVPFDSAAFRQNQNILHPAEAAAVAVPAQAATSLSALLANHIIRDGEVVLLVLKPSFWFLVLNTISFAAFVALLAAAAVAMRDQRIHDHIVYETASFLVAGRLMFTILQWMGRLYILTDMRVLRITGIFAIDIFDCPLRKVIRTRLVSTPGEKCFATGSIEIIPKDQDKPSAIWQTIAKPAEVHEILVAAINRAKQSGTGGE
jgi:hypothetical protein